MVWIGCIRCEKLRHKFVARNFALIAPVLAVWHQVPCSNEIVPNTSKQYEMHQNLSLGSKDVDCVHLLWKLPKQLRCTNFALIAPIRPVLHRVSNSNETVPNEPKHYETHQNMSLGSNGVDRVPSLRKITTQLRCTNFWINCTSFARFAPSSVQ